MKLTFFIMLAFFLQAGATGLAQHQKVTLDCQNKTLASVFKMLEEQTELYFFFNDQILNTEAKVSISVENERLDNVLNRLLGADYGWEVVSNLIVVKIATDEEKQVKKKRVQILGKVTDEVNNPLPGVTIKLKGTNVGMATDKNGRFDFRFMEQDQMVLVFSFIGMKTKEHAYKGGKDSLHIILYEEKTEMEEVVITGYQKIEKRHLTSAVTSLKASDIMDPGKNTIDQMLEGYVPGMIFMQNSGQVGAAPKLRIRGSSTVLGSREPLWVVDGIIQYDPVTVDPAKLNDPDFVNLLGNAIAGLNPEDIEQIDVLKDASATALYGTRAANGVIVVTTKKGKIGPPSISYALSGTYSRRPHYSDRQVHLMNSEERINFSRELLKNKQEYPYMESWVGYEGAARDYWNGLMTFGEFQDEVSYYETLNTDWFDVLTRNSFTNNHTLSISGGSTALRYYASVGFSNINGVLRGEGNDRYTANLKITANYEKFAVQFGLSGVLFEKEYEPTDLGLLSYAYRMNRAVPVFDKNGDYWFYEKADSERNLYKYNILNEIENSSDTQEQHQVSFNTTVDYKLLPELKLGATLSYSQSNTYQEMYRGEKTHYAATLRKADYGLELDDKQKAAALLPSGGELQESNSRKQNWTLRLQADFNKFVDKDEQHLISAALGGEIASTRDQGTQRTIRGYVPERGKIINPTSDKKYTLFQTWLATDPAALGKRTDNLSNMASVYMSLSYSYKNTYVLNFNTRMDGSNQFGLRSNEKLLPVWSVSGRWNMKENVWQNVGFVNDMALRTSFGYQGNTPSGGPDLIIKKGGWNALQNHYSSEISSYPNPKLRWEKTMSLNVGLDFSLWRNKITGSVSYFYKKTNDAFLNKTISEINGLSNYTVNSGTLENQGYELTFRFTPIDNTSLSGGGDGFRWTFDPNIGQVLNRLINKAVNNQEKVVRDVVRYEDYLKGIAEVPGRSLDSFFSYKFASLDAKDGRPTFFDANKTEEVNGETLNIANKYKGMDKEEVFLEVMEYSGSRTPFIQGSISNTFSYKRLILSFSLGYSLGSKIRLMRLYEDAVTQYGTLAPLPHRNVRKEFANRWQRPGDEARTNMPGIISNAEFTKTMNPWWKGEAYKFADNIWQMYDDSNVRVVSGNYLKMNNLSLRYVLPEKLCKKMYMKSAYVSVSTSNLFTIASRKLKGQSPTQSGTSPNINLSLCPSYSLSFNVSF